MTARKFLFSMFFVFFGTDVLAYVPKDGNVWGTVGATLSRPDFAKEDGEKAAPWMGGLGLIVMGDLNDKSSLELGLLYGNKVYLRESGPNSVEEQTQIIHATAGYRYWLTRRWSLTGSFYTGYAVGDPSTIRREIRQGEDYGTTARDTSESGFDLSLEVELWQRDRYAVILNGRYSYAYPFKPDEKSNQVGTMLGFRYFIQGRQKFKPEATPPPAKGPPKLPEGVSRKRK